MSSEMQSFSTDIDILFPLLKSLALPYPGNDDGSFGGAPKGCPDKMETLSSLLEGSTYEHILGKNYYRLYAKTSLDNLKNFKRILLVSSHADTEERQDKPVYKDNGANIRGIFDNASTNAVCVYLMKYATLPENVVFAFTADEEDKLQGAKHIAEDLKMEFPDTIIDAITLDVTACGWDSSADFTIENDFIYKEYDGKSFIGNLCDAINGKGISFEFIKAAEYQKEKNPSDYISGDKISKLMKDGLIAVKQYKQGDLKNAPDEDESMTYDDNDFNALSICLPCSAKNGSEMHSADGFEISKEGISNYTKALFYILEKY